MQAIALGRHPPREDTTGTRLRRGPGRAESSQECREQDTMVVNSSLRPQLCLWPLKGAVPIPRDVWSWPGQQHPQQAPALLPLPAPQRGLGGEQGGKDQAAPWGDVRQQHEAGCACTRLFVPQQQPSSWPAPIPALEIKVCSLKKIITAIIKYLAEVRAGKCYRLVSESIRGTQRLHAEAAVEL